jgi:hypothetical protein
MSNRLVYSSSCNAFWDINSFRRSVELPATRRTPSQRGVCANKDVWNGQVHFVMLEQISLRGLGLGLLDRLGSLGLLSLGGVRGGGGLRVVTIGRGPEGEVVAEELHDEGAVAVRLFGERVKLGNGVVKGLLGKVACAVRRVQDLVVEDGEVQGETETDGVGRGELSLGNIGGALRGRVSVSCMYENGLDRDKPCRPRGQQWRQSCACHQRRIRRGNGGSHPSCVACQR